MSTPGKHTRNPGWESGNYWMCCDRCGFEYRMDEMRQEWTGLIVCDECWEIRHPQDFVRGVRDDQAPEWQIRPCPVEKFTGICDDYVFTPPGPPPPTFCNSLDPTNCPGFVDPTNEIAPDEIAGNGLGKGANGSNLVLWLDANDLATMYTDQAWTVPHPGTLGVPIQSILNKAFPLASFPVRGTNATGDFFGPATDPTFESPHLISAQPTAGNAGFAAGFTRSTLKPRTFWRSAPAATLIPPWDETGGAINGMPTRTEILVARWPDAMEPPVTQIIYGSDGSVERWQTVWFPSPAFATQLFANPGSTSYPMNSVTDPLVDPFTELIGITVIEYQYPSIAIGGAGTMNIWANNQHVQNNTTVNWRTTAGANSALRIGEQFNGTAVFREDICEIIWYDRLLTNVELNGLVNGLQTKWGFPTSIPIIGNLAG